MDDDLDLTFPQGQHHDLSYTHISGTSLVHGGGEEVGH